MNHHWTSNQPYFFGPQSGQGFSSAQPTLNYKPKAYINPQVVNCQFFKKPCINLQQSSRNKIHVNPNFKGNNIGRLIQNKTGLQTSSAVQFNPPIEGQSSRFKKVNNPRKPNRYTWSKGENTTGTTNYSNNSSCHVAVEKPILKTSKPIFISKTKLVNKISESKSTLKYKVHSPAKKQNVPKFTCYKNKYSPILKVARVVKNKYKLWKAPKKKVSKYKLDKRKKIETSVKKSSCKETKDIRKLFPRNMYKIVRSGSSLTKKNQNYQSSAGSSHIWRKNDRSETTSKIRNHYPNRRVVKIGGILYKSTTNKLVVAKAVTPTSSKKLPATKANKHHIVYVRGEKFILDKNGKTLRRQSQNTSSVKRIDIGGVTYLQKSRNVLVRTNVHKARNLVNKAKHRSIATLTRLRKRSSMPCMIFHKFGKCMRHSKGLCIYKHDPKNVALCKKFLKGNCTTPNCLLSHEAIQEKMATCKFFLNGFCSRENCPFLHVKLSEKAAICEDFLRGFCQLGKNCSKRHVYVCPEFERTGICSQGSNCHYPHKTMDKGKKLTSVPSKNSKPDDVQYYVKPMEASERQNSRPKKSKGRKKSDLKSEKKAKRKLNETMSGSEGGDNMIECVPKRVKLDELPCFIPLKSDS